jgi:hypothetical protein
MIFTTSICANYLPRALCLGASIKRHYPKARFYPCLLERSVPADAAASPYFDGILLAKDFVPFNFEHFVFRYSIVEAATAVKGDLFLHLFDAFPDEDTFIYLDPDTHLYSSMPELETLLQDQSIVLTPHLLSETGLIPMEVSSLEHGLYNLGFLGLRRSAESVRLNTWWADRLHRMCYDAKFTGIFTDQRWFDLVPLFFKAALLLHPGYNVGPWALHSRPVDLAADGDLLFCGQPLRFMHFSGFPEIFYRCIEGWAPQNKERLFELANSYADALEANKRFAAIPWSYGCYRSGKRISGFSRMRWRQRPVDGDVSPFDLSDRKILGKWVFMARLDSIYTRLNNKYYEKMRSYFHIWE